jgi:hypothetical protein
MTGTLTSKDQIDVSIVKNELNQRLSCDVRENLFDLFYSSYKRGPLPDDIKLLSVNDETDYSIGLINRNISLGVEKPETLRYVEYHESSFDQCCSISKFEVLDEFPVDVSDGTVKDVHVLINDFSRRCRQPEVLHNVEFHEGSCVHCCPKNRLDNLDEFADEKLKDITNEIEELMTKTLTSTLPNLDLPEQVVKHENVCFDDILDEKVSSTFIYLIF